MTIKEIRKTLFFLLIGTAVWLILIVLAPIFKSSENNTLKSISDYLYFFFEPVCHQQKERSILLNFEPLAVCIRCFAIYLGAFGFLLFSIFVKKMHTLNPGKMILVSIPTIADFIIEKFGLFAEVPIIRFFTGLLFGVLIIYLILYSLLDKRKIFNKTGNLLWKIRD